ncbi:hypothetical protein [Leclercia adecarboxylata]|uniref:hypothetical protein n=1 Tax=Leclercia adecarboxylata TaxID=83655 RepID=UPI002549FAAD|nr:hypothetical protein [Leclercia adecarboxylata]
MAKADELTFSEFSAINSRLRLVSDIWSDLWVVIYYSQMSIGKLLSLRFEDVSGIEPLKISGNINLLTDNPVKQIIKKRHELYPDDIFLFQSHSNRVKAIAKPVTVIAFNQALKNVAKYVTEKNVSSSSARRVQKIIHKAA